MIAESIVRSRSQRRSQRTSDCAQTIEGPAQLTAPYNRKYKLHLFWFSWTQKVEITTLITLKYVINVKLRVASKVNMFFRAALSRTLRELLRRQQNVEASLRDIQTNDIATLNEGEWPVGGGLGTAMQHYGSIACPTHPCIADTDHVMHSGSLKFARNRNGAPLGHTGYPLGSAILQDQY